MVLGGVCHRPPSLAYATRKQKSREILSWGWSRATCVFFYTVSRPVCVVYAIIVPLPHTRVDNTNIYIPCYRVAYPRTRAFESSFRVLNLIGCRMSVLSRLGAMIYVAISKKEFVIIFRRDYKVLGFMSLYFEYGIFFSLSSNNAEHVS